jgi:glycosyltransferase involved in cell wall biosynthesis
MGDEGVQAVSAVLPAYNEAQNLPVVLPRLQAALQRHLREHEILVVDDGSRDETPQVLAKLAAGIPTLRVLRHERNRGYGAALRTGFAAARHPWIFLMDADDQFDPEEVERLLAASGGADIVTGYRLARRDPLLRWLNAWAFFTVARLALGPLARDVNCAFKLLRTELVGSLGLVSEGALINAECLAKARRRGARVEEVPVHHYPRRLGKQTGADPRVVARAFRELFRLRGRLRASP